MRHMTKNRFDKAVQTEKRNHDDSSSVESSNQTKRGVAIQTNPVTTVDAHTQSDSHQYAITERTPIVSDNNDDCQGKLGGHSLETPEKRESQDEGFNTTKEMQQESSVQTVMLSFRGQNTPAVLEQNYELRGKVLEQGKRINYLTMRIAQLHAGLAEQKIPEQRRIGTTQTDASINTIDNKMTQTTLDNQTCKTCSVHKINDQKRVPRLDSNPLKKALWTAKAEIAALKQERRRIQEFCQPND